MWDTIFPYLLSGISVGGQYALIAIGYTMVYGILRLINFAHGDVFMVAGLMMVYMAAALPLYIAIPLMIVLTVFLGFMIERVAYRPLRTAPRMSVMISAIGVSYLIQNLALYITGGLNKNYPAIPWISDRISIFGVETTRVTVITPFLTVLLVILLVQLINHTKIGMATNPSTCNTRTYYNSMTAWGSDYRENPRNLRTTFLSGLSIEMIPQKDGNILVRIRWDDYDITDDANWTGKIALKEKAFLQPRRHLLLTQNLTPEQPYRDSVTGLFAKSTLLTCEAGSEFVLQSHSTMELEKGSRVLLKSGSRFEIAEKALLKIGKDCVFEVEPGAQLIVHQNGKIKNISNGKLLLHKGVKIFK